MGYLSHPYAWRLASASFAGATIERLQYRDTLDVVIRFADWRGRRFQPKALEIGENELLVLLGDALANKVLSETFGFELKLIALVQGSRVMVDYDYARNYWRKIFCSTPGSKFSEADFDKWFPGRPGNGEFNDQLLEAFIQMMKACAQGQFGK